MKSKCQCSGISVIEAYRNWCHTGSQNNNITPNYWASNWKTYWLGKEKPEISREKKIIKSDMSGVSK